MLGYVYENISREDVERGRSILSVSSKIPQADEIKEQARETMEVQSCSPQSVAHCERRTFLCHSFLSGHSTFSQGHKNRDIYDILPCHTVTRMETSMTFYLVTQ